MVLRAGLEPARISPHAPQTCAATNYATSAIFKNRKIYLLAGAFAFAAGAELVEAPPVEQVGNQAANTASNANASTKANSNSTKANTAAPKNAAANK